MLAVVVALALGSVLALAAGSRRASTAFERYFEADDLPDVLVNAESEPTAELVEAFGSDPRIARVERADMVVIAPAPLEPGEAGFTLVGTEGSVTGGFGRPALVAGRYPDSSSSTEIMVNEETASTFGFHPGQRVALNAIRCFEGCPAEPAGEATIVGIVRLATDLTADPQVSGVAFGSPAFLDGGWRDFARPASFLGVHVHRRDDIAAVVADLSVQVTDGDVADARGATAPLDRAGRWQRNALAVAAAIVGLAGALILVQALARHLGGRPKDPDVLAAIGVTPRERSVAGVLSVIPGIIGGIAGGVAVAVGVSPLLPLGVVRRADPDIGVHADAGTLALASLAALVIMIGAASLCARRWATPSTAGTVKRTPSIAARLASDVGLRPVPATGAQFALAPDQGRTRLPVVPTVFVLACAVAVVAGALVVRWSLDGLVAGRARFGQGYDVRVGFGSAGDWQTSARRLAADPRVRDVAISRQGAVNLLTRNGTPLQVATTGIESITGPAPLAVLDGRAPAGPREIALASATMTAVGLSTGDRTTLSGPCGQFEVAVVGRVIVPLTSSNYPDDGSILTLDAFDELCAQDNVNSIDVNTSALVRLRDDELAGAVRDEWQAQGLSVHVPETPNSVGLIRELRAVPIVVGAIVTVLGSAAAAHALVLTVHRRRRDLAVLRTFGLRPGQARGIIRWQAATLALVALLVGVPLGLVLGRVVWTSIAGPSNVVVRSDVNVLGLTVLVVGVAAIAAAASIWPAHRAAQLRPPDALRAE
jgi:ABC-type lipoprotein release transport system permease subunit